MAEAEVDGFLDNDHQAAYIFNPDEEPVEATRPVKKRKVSRKSAQEPVKVQKLSGFPRLFETESAACMSLRQQLYDKTWASIDSRIQNVLRESNTTTLQEVGSFVREAPAETAKIPSAFIITGPNIASQDLLFGQLAESLHDVVEGKFVRMLSVEAPNLKACLKKIIRDVTRRGPDFEEDVEVSIGKDGRKYLDYDLEALHAFVKTHESKQVIIAFQDSEAFDTSLLTDLIQLFQTWQNRVHFTLLFGVATSVELFQARLPKSAAQHLYGSQFDVVQASAVLESIFKCAVAHTKSPLLIGPNLLRSIVDRQHDQVAGIQDFISSLKYAYMCHFYANLLSVFMAPAEQLGDQVDQVVQTEHLEAARNLPSFRSHVEAAVDASSIQHIRPLLTDDAYLEKQAIRHVVLGQKWTTVFLRSLLYLVATGIPKENFITLYINGTRDGIDFQSETSGYLDSMRRMTPDETVLLIQRIIAVTKAGDADLGVRGWEAESQDILKTLSSIQQEIEKLKAQAEEKGNTLRSKYTAQSKILRTTVIAQKVQLSQDTAALTEEDNAYSGCLDSLMEHLTAAVSCEPSDSMFLHEIWRFDFKSPHKDVFTPRPGSVLERALARPHDYLACACCGQAEGGVAASLPATAILYHLYLETGALVNVADLWTAFYAQTGESSDEGVDERTALVLFYRALSDLRTLGFVKASKKKADHIAKLKWL